jgi:hypothetical protein
MFGVRVLRVGVCLIFGLLAPFNVSVDGARGQAEDHRRDERNHGDHESRGTGPIGDRVRQLLDG